MLIYVFNKVLKNYTIRLTHKPGMDVQQRMRIICTYLYTENVDKK